MKDKSSSVNDQFYIAPNYKRGLSDRLKRLRIEKYGISPGAMTQCAHDLGYHRTRWGKFENSETVVKSDLLDALRRFFACARLPSP